MSPVSGVRARLTLPTVSPVPSVHEQVEQRAQKQQHKRQDAEEVGLVFGREEEAVNREKAQQHPSRPRPGQIAPLRLPFESHMFISSSLPLTALLIYPTPVGYYSNQKIKTHITCHKRGSLSIILATFIERLT